MIILRDQLDQLQLNLNQLQLPNFYQGNTNLVV